MPVRRDAAEWVREAWLDVSQVPTAGMHTASWSYQQWASAVSSFVGYASARLALARPTDSTEILVEDLVRATERLARQVINLPGETATYFNRQLERQRRTLSVELRPNASTEPLLYVGQELDRLVSEITRLQQIASWPAGDAVRATGDRGVRGAGDGTSRDHHRDTLEALRGSVREAADAVRRAEGPRRAAAQASRGPAPPGQRAKQGEPLARVKGAIAALDADGVLSEVGDDVRRVVDALRQTLDREMTRLTSEP